MRHFVRHLCRVALLGCILGGAASAALAQAYPNKPIKLIVPFAPGGFTDVVARILGQKLSVSLGQPFVIENKAGAGSTIGTDFVAKAAPDGYTLVMVSTTHVISPAIYPKLPYDPIKSFTPVGKLVDSAYVLLVNPKVPANNVAEFIALAKASPDKIHYASSGNGSSQHLMGGMFAAMAGVKMKHVPYKGSAGAVNDLISGEVSAMFSSLPSLQGLADKGLVKVLAATAPSKSAATKSLPLISTSLPGFDYTTWYAMYAPLATPKPIVDSINAALTKALKNTAMAAKIEAAGTELQPGSPEEVMAWTQRDTDKWARVIRDAKISVE
jgi:tripartite-type tricarboxylate transporter receptor subunit TctC